MVALCGIGVNCKVSAFVNVEDPVRMLTDTHVLEFGPECEVYKDHRATTDEIKHLCSGTYTNSRALLQVIEVHRCGFYV